MKQVKYYSKMAKAILFHLCLSCLNPIYHIFYDFLLKKKLKTNTWELNHIHDNSLSTFYRSVMHEFLKH